MNLLSDTHTFLWFVQDDPHLSPLSRHLIASSSLNLRSKICRSLVRILNWMPMVFNASGNLPPVVTFPTKRILSQRRSENHT